MFLVLLDQSAAFDTVHQDLLLHKLCCRYGITGSALTLLSSYFKGRTQSVMIDGTSSEPKELKTGFPQGSVLGPYMYPLYTSELFEIAQKHGINIHMYADDTQLYVACDPAHRHETLKMLETAISEIRQWMIANHLKLNDSKTEFMVMRKPSLRKNIEDTTRICIGDTAVHAANHAQNIGTTLDTEITMTGHINNTSKSCYSQIRQISHIRARGEKTTKLFFRQETNSPM